VRWQPASRDVNLCWWLLRSAHCFPRLDLFITTAQASVHDAAGVAVHSPLHVDSSGFHSDNDSGTSSSAASSRGNDNGKRRKKHKGSAKKKAKKDKRKADSGKGPAAGRDDGHSGAGEARQCHGHHCWGSRVRRGSATCWCAGNWLCHRGTTTPASALLALITTIQLPRLATAMLFSSCLQVASATLSTGPIQATNTVQVVRVHRMTQPDNRVVVRAGQAMAAHRASVQHMTEQRLQVRR
jgi:hypothetical protein